MSDEKLIRDEILTRDALEELARRMAPPPLPDWAVKLRDADEVTVCGSDFVKDEEYLYVLDPSVLPGWVQLLPEDSESTITVICHPSKKARVEEMIAGLRNEGMGI